MRSSVPPLVLALVFAAIVVACGGGSAPSASGPAATASPAPVVTAEEAVAAVVAHEPRFAGIRPRDADLIGQSSWYEVMAASGVGAFLVELRIGWGDCPAGCIDEHTWRYAVGPNGGVTLRSERGPAVPADAWPSPGTGNVLGTGLLITAVAGPVCPVETIPAKPECAPRPVVGAIIHVRDDQGAEVATGTTDATGSAFLAVEPGSYAVVADRVDGLLGEPPAQDSVVSDGTTTPLTLTYDTGIR